MSALFIAGLVIWVTALAGAVTRRLSGSSVNGLLAIMSASFMINDMLNGSTPFAVFQAACCAWFAYAWWTRGGGGGTRRRLRALRRKFTGVRRTAPQPT
jgi:hypothetical protein